MTEKQIEFEVRSTLENDIMDSLLWYFQEYPQDKYAFAKCFKKEFRELVNEILKEIEEQEEE